MQRSKNKQGGLKKIKTEKKKRKKLEDLHHRYRDYYIPTVIKVV